MGFTRQGKSTQSRIMIDMISKAAHASRDDWGQSAEEAVRASDFRLNGCILRYFGHAVKVIRSGEADICLLYLSAYGVRLLKQ